jgi:hypothetical protein
MSTKHKRRIKYLAFILATALLIVLMALVSAMSTVSPAVAQVATCTDCHNVTTLITGKKTEWEESLHGTGEAYLRGTSASCAGCHSGGGFSAMVAAGQQPNQVTVGDPNPTRQDCRACHQIHTSYTGTDWALETIAPVSLYALPGKTFDGGNGNLCAKCHQPRTKAPVAVNGVVTGITNRYGPHHGPQSSMMLGTGGAGIEGTSAAHYQYVENTCVGCHMGSTASHTYEPKVATCKGCHATATNFDINGVQTATQAKLDQLGNLLVNAGVLNSIDPAVAAPTVTSAQENVAYALFNWIYIAKEDKSKGVHNPGYTAALLDASIAAIELPFNAKWDALGGAPGAATSAATAITGGMYKNYVNGRLYYNQGTNEVYWVHGEILLKYNSLGRENGFLGLPKSDEQDVSGVAGGRWNQFTSGNIYWSATTGAREMHGAILVKYLALGPAAFGLPTTDETGVPGYAPGRKSELVGATIYWSGATGAYEVHGAIRGKWLAMGGPAVFGMPTSDEQDLAGGAKWSQFQGVNIYWSATTGAREVHGAILAKYIEYGGRASALGLPTSDEYSSGSGRRSDFVGGYIYWDASGGAQVVI